MPRQLAPARAEAQPGQLVDGTEDGVLARDPLRIVQRQPAGPDRQRLLHAEDAALHVGQRRRPARSTPAVAAIVCRCDAGGQQHRTEDRERRQARQESQVSSSTLLRHVQVGQRAFQRLGRHADGLGQRRMRMDGQADVGRIAPISMARPISAISSPALGPTMPPPMMRFVAASTMQLGETFVAADRQRAATGRPRETPPCGSRGHRASPGLR